jgi:hypothetical protein
MAPRNAEELQTWSGTKDEFLKDPDVTDLLDWLAGTCQRELSITSGASPWRPMTSAGRPWAPWPICDLRIPTSRFVPRPISGRFFGFDHVIPNYLWKSSWIEPGPPAIEVASDDWATTVHSLDRLSTWLRGELHAGATPGAPGLLNACLEVLRWGGDRDPRVGATPFLHECYATRRLGAYLGSCLADVKLDSARLPLARFELTNSMMIKIYALAADDGLPIYDSRVAAATACLVELYRLHRKPGWKAIPASLAFPATLSSVPRRSVVGLHPGAMSPGAFVYSTRIATANAWAAAAVRLGWLMRGYLERFHITGLAQAKAMRGIEAGLFMMGYDVACLRPNLPPISAPPVAAANPRRHARTLGSRPIEFTYTRTVDGTIEIDIGRRDKLRIPAELTNALLEEFAGTTVALGANRTNPPPGSIGEWLTVRSRDFGASLSSQHGSRLVGVLVALGLAEGVPFDEAPAPRTRRGRRSVLVRILSQD